MHVLNSKTESLILTRWQKSLEEGRRPTMRHLTNQLADRMEKARQLDETIKRNLAELGYPVGVRGDGMP